MLTAMLAIVSPLVHGHGPDADEIAMGSLADAEIAFARMAAERGIRDAFLANFDDQGIAFEPAPVRLRSAWSARPAPSDPLAQRLDWKPLQVGVSRSRDFGYTTGPFTLTDRSRPGVVRHGVYFSVWRKDSMGRWKVLLDAGVSTPGVTNFADMGEPPRPHFQGNANIAAERRKLVAIENATAQGLAPNAYGKLLADDARLHRNALPPIGSRAAATAEVARRTTRIVWQPDDAFVARSADMAVTYGHYREADRNGAAHDGYYAHLWVRAADGQWRLAYDIALPSS
jgi:ketosteroid isomerase-like protein